MKKSTGEGKQIALLVFLTIAWFVVLGSNTICCKGPLLIIIPIMGLLVLRQINQLKAAAMEAEKKDTGT